jgi:hypothetical protein
MANSEGWLLRRSIGDRLARFRQINRDNPAQHHDALEFADGTFDMVTDLVVGQNARILQQTSITHGLGSGPELL